MTNEEFDRETMLDEEIQSRREQAIAQILRDHGMDVDEFATAEEADLYCQSKCWI